MSHLRALAVLIISASIAAWSTVYAEETGQTYIYAGKLIAAPGEAAPLNTQTIIISGSMIQRVEAGFVSAPEGVQVIDLRAATVLPGLIDSHVHLLMNLGPETQIKALTQTDVEAAFDGAANASTTLMAGFTTVQDVGGRNDAIFGLRDAIAAGKIPGPRVLASGLALTANGGPTAIACSGADECRRVTRQQIVDGADVIKLAVTGGTIMSMGEAPARFTPEEFQAVVATAESMGRKVVVHAHGKDSITFALTNGAHSIEHGSYLDAETAALFAETDAVLVPTLMAGRVIEGFAANPMAPEDFRTEASVFGSRMIQATAFAYEAGVPIVFGTDVGAAVHGDNAQEFTLMVEAGLTPEEAIRAATIDGAKHLRLSELIGSIEAGKAADIIAVFGDPLADVTVLESVVFVMKGGVIYKTPEQ